MADLDHLPPRPLPIGAFRLPFGYLLVPPDATAEREALLSGRLPESWPESMRGHALAWQGDLPAALAAMTGPDVVSRFNRFVIEPGSEDADAIRADLGPELAVLVDLVEFARGDRDDPPPVEGLHGELAALALSSQAAVAEEAGEHERATELLTTAITEVEEIYPALAAFLYGAAGQAQSLAGDADAAIAALRAGTRLLEDTDLAVGRAELHLELAGLYHEQAGERRDLLTRAIHEYHTALQLITQEQAPELFATTHMNLATAYLTMPMVEASDQLRLGVAVASLRAALQVFTQEKYPRQWASAQLNLANSLVYAPSTHRADNLVEAVELYEAVLGARSREEDPLGYARVLANQGNALAHLGLVEDARGKLVEARYLFEEARDYDGLASVRGILDEIARVTVLAGAEQPS